ncbi:aminopeptidase PepB [Thalassotalea euphylliae]|uniref:Aminopeptidase PepB n=1 Tax=Thalassotalea euphylliae TaxID=1655234 RepID=A0A3E0TWJ6_9GAMM|nr:aminopeptidase PepB [Thalassotalea euphylliae]REL28365.1 aminopeptidase PepB [Thalassotalea euphylliae]
MTTTSLFLSNQPPSTGWQANNLIQVIDDHIHVYLEPESLYPLRDLQRAGRKIDGLGVKHIHFDGDAWSAEQQWAVALGFTSIGKLTNVDFSGEQQAELSKKLAVYAWARDLTNQTPAELYPLSLAEKTVTYLSGLAGDNISTTITAGEALVEQGWLGIYNVGKASANPPCLLEVDYNPTGDSQAPVTACLVGKGITFDSGGYSIKSNAGMFDMKCDMGGAAVVAGAFALAIEQGLNKRVKLYLCCAENMINGHAYKLGDVIRYKNGVTMEVANTDAEGRIVLADGLLAAGDTGAPLIIDAATLTGAAVSATGGDYSALFSLDQQTADQAINVARAVNEPIWQLPLEQWHQTKCPSAFADTANSRPIPGGGPGGASNAAGFLSRFVPNQGKGWLHFDIAAAYHGKANELWAVGATGLSIATIAQLVLDAE